MNKAKPPITMPSIRLKQKLKLMMGKLKQPFFQQNQKYATLYNDFLILNVIVNSVPEKCIQELSSELEILDKGIEEQSDKQGKRKRSKLNKEQQSKENGSEGLSLSGVIKVLQGVQSQDMLLNDFLKCSGSEIKTC